MSVIVHRSTPDNTELPSLLVAAETLLDIGTSLASSLSGPLSDYIIREERPTAAGESVWSVTAKSCYQQRFREGQQKLCLSETRLWEAQEKLDVMNQVENDRELCFATMEVYRGLEKSMLLAFLFCVHDLTSILHSS
jgi:hypothetical protein